MPQFSYNAVDGTGRTVQGVLDASTENELIVRLSGQGLRVQQTGLAQSRRRPRANSGPQHRPLPAPRAQPAACERFLFHAIVAP